MLARARQQARAAGVPQREWQSADRHPSEGHNHCSEAAATQLQMVTEATQNTSVQEFGPLTTGLAHVSMSQSCLEGMLK